MIAVRRCILFASALCAGCFASAAPINREQVFDRISITELKRLMQEEGYAVEDGKEDYVVWKIDGYKSEVWLSRDPWALQFHTGFGSETALERVNEWNRSKRFSRSYLTAEKHPHLELDQDLTGGVTRQRIVDFLRTCRISFVNWLDEVVP